AEGDLKWPAMENDGRRAYHALSRAGLKVAHGFHARWDVAARGGA
ncbi:hypothetical protein A2U01_0101412, partial [Trifolium medium]|nr:hypothetical protein [Trifolium medium]